MKIGYREIAEILGVGSIVGSLIFVGLEMNQTQQIAQNERSYFTVQSDLEMANAINSHPDIWVRGNAGEELTPAEFVVYENLVRNSWAIAFWNTQAQRRFGSNLDVALNDFAFFLHLNPGAREAWQNFSDQEQYYRGLLLESPAGRSQAEEVLADLEYLDRISNE